MGFFSSGKRKAKSLTAQINKLKKQLEKKKQRATIASLRKQLRGY